MGIVVYKCYTSIVCGISNNHSKTTQNMTETVRNKLKLTIHQLHTKLKL